ncbi:large conductance mechanosensitive channel protein MscL [Bizionia paragorgiae]|uniref:large conductance mechanosensitive channel protein MscL n=1 Tax=Bizionia paragorgiae TaxID=283786 RepID=UPI00299D270C|nr:large conductance mechanosensitive channel protein MscL [Bizionia paragorgiae]MDX1270502.1 large conductance mechanosensitive channel protein MscL [Bizionia paragorgiae]
MGFFKEFKEFAVKGNMMDMAIGIIIGASFNKVIDVLVKKVLMPPLSLMSNGINLQNRKLVLRTSELDEAGKVLVEEVAIQYGALAEALIDFLIIGMTIFVVVKAMNKLRDRSQNPKDKTVKTPKDIQLLSELNTLMQEQNELLRKQKSQGEDK